MRSCLRTGSAKTSNRRELVGRIEDSEEALDERLLSFYEGERLDVEEMGERRSRYDKRIMDTVSFFREFGALDDRVYAEGAISRKHKE